MSLSINVTAGKLLARNERANNAKLNSLGLPTVALAGTASTAQIGAYQVTPNKLAFATSSGGAPYYCTASTSANVITLTAGNGETISDTQLVAGALVVFKADANTTGAVDIKLGAGTAKNVFKDATQELAAGDIRSDQMCVAEYDGTQWQLVSNLGNGAWDRFAETAGTNGLAYTATFAPTVSALTNGTRVVVKWNITNTGEVTFAPDGRDPKAVRKGADAALVAGDIVDNQISELLYDTSANGGAGAWLITGPTTATTRTTVPVRQCVLSCSVASTGLPNYATGVGGTAISFQNCDTTPLVIAFAAGYDSSGAVDYVATVNTNTSNVWTGLSTDGTYYLWVDRNTTTGALTYGKTATLLRPSYVNGGSAATIDTQHTFLINSMTMWVGNGTTASQVQRVFLGEVVVAANKVSSITLYMPRGQFQSGTDDAMGAINANTTYTQTHQLGVTPRQIRWVIVCGTADLNYAVGDELPVTSMLSTTAYLNVVSEGANATSAYLVTSFAVSANAGLLDKTGYSVANITAARWTMRCYAWRGW